MVLDGHAASRCVRPVQRGRGRVRRRSRRKPTYLHGDRPVAGNPTIQYGGGAVRLTPNPTTGTVNVKQDNWIMLYNTAPAAPMLPMAIWYRVVNAGPGGSTQDINVVGPDWPSGWPAATPVYALVIDTVTGVYTTTMQLDSDAIWTQ